MNASYAAALSPPRTVLNIANRLQNAGFETWCVGGAVRDALLGQAHLDWDLATAARPQEVRRLFRRTVPVGIEFGTVGVLDEDGVMHEVTTFRRDVRTDGRHAEVEFGASLDEDLARRDFTINAVAYDPATGRLHDPFGGREDLRNGLVRAVGNAEERMREDRLRALRAIRFAARFGFEIEPATWSAVMNSAPFLNKLSPERVRQELEKTMEQVERPSRAIDLWTSSGALDVLVPGLAAVSPLTLASLDELSRPDGPKAAQRKLNRLAALFADLPTADVTGVLESLRFSNREVAWIAAIRDRWQKIAPQIEHALRLGEAVQDAQVRRWVSAAGRMRASSVLRLAAAHFKAQRRLGLWAPTSSSLARMYRRMMKSAFRDPIALNDLAVDGDDLLEAGIPRGPAIGKMLGELLDAVLSDTSLNQRETLLDIARENFGRPSRPPPQES